MVNLFWRTKNKVISLLDTPFKSEQEFEKSVFENSELLEDIFLLKRQIRGGKKRGIPDIIGVDGEGNICIIEMKNTTVDSSIISQVVEYAIWATKNPDSIKSLWLECKDKPEDITIDWEKIQVRIIIVAPVILKSVLDSVGIINCQTDLVEIKRWIKKNNEFLMVNKLKTENNTKIKPTSGLENYDKKFYMKNHNSKSVKDFIWYAKQIERLTKSKSWNLELKFNKNYCGFKAGFFNAFGIKWINSKTFAFFVKITEKEAKKFKPKMDKYNRWNEAEYYIIAKDTKVSDFAKIFEFSYKKIAGE